MNLRAELVHLNSSGFQIYKFNINLFYKSNSGAEGEPNPNPGSNACGGRMRYAPTKFGEFIVECNTNDNPVPGLDSGEHLAAADTRWLSGIESHPWL